MRRGLRRPRAARSASKAAILAPALAAALLWTPPAWAQIRFEDASGALPVQHVYGGGWEHFVGGGVAVWDCDGDGRLDIAAAGGAAPARLFRNRISDAGWAFEAAPLPRMTGVTGIWPVDIDSDGWHDLAVLRAGGNVFLRGGPECRFSDATALWGIAPGAAWSTAFTATWEAGAAWPTLAIGNYVDRDDPEGPFGTCDDNRLYRGGAGPGYGPPVALRPGFCALSALFARGGSDRMRLRLSNDRHYYVEGGHEQMWDLAQGRWLGPEDGWPPLALWGMGIAARDLNGDGLDEVMLTSMADQHLQIALAGGGFRAAPYEMGLTAHRPHTGDDGRPSTGWHAEFGDVDNDGLADLFIAKGNVDQMPGNAMADPDNLLRQRRDGRFEEVSTAAGIADPARSRGAALADFDGDGRLDLVTVRRRAPMRLYRNVSSAGAWLSVMPVQPAPNIFAVGARVELRAGGVRQSQEVTVGGGHGGGDAGPLHFGLGDAEGAEIRVLWPDGTASDWAPVPADRRLWLRRSGAAGLAIHGQTAGHAFRDAQPP